jgi:hypothetical protein
MYGYENDYLAVDYLLPYVNLEVKLWWKDSIVSPQNSTKLNVSDSSVVISQAVMKYDWRNSPQWQHVFHFYAQNLLYKHILLLQPRGVCTLGMGYLLVLIIEFWLKGNQIEYSFTTVTTLLPKISLCMLHKRQVVGMCSERSCTSFHSLCSYKLFYWYEQYLLPEIHVILKVLVKMLHLILLFYQGCG